MKSSHLRGGGGGGEEGPYLVSISFLLIVHTKNTPGSAGLLLLWLITAFILHS